MALKKQSTMGEGTITKGKSASTAGDIIPPSGSSHMAEDVVSTPSHEATNDIHPSSTYEAQLQMFAEMEESAKQQVMFDHERGQAEQDWENVARELEEMKRLNDQLLVQIAVFQNTRVPFYYLRGLQPRRPQATSNLKVGGVAL